jgi:hypothetical protein
VEENAIFVLFDLGRHFEEREDHSGGLGGSQCRMGQCVGAQGMMEDIGGARQQEVVYPTTADNYFAPKTG